MGNILKRTLAPLLVLGVVLSGCAQAPEESVNAQYVQPAWMAEAKEQFETSRNEYINCLTSKGLRILEAGNGDVAYILPPTIDEDSPEFQILNEQGQQCSALAPALYRKGDVNNAYQMMLDTHECLLAQGFPLSTPPSREVWAEEFKKEMSNEVYLPYIELSELQEQGIIEPLSFDEFGELQRHVCISSAAGGGVTEWIMPDN